MKKKSEFDALEAMAANMNKKLFLVCYQLCMFDEMNFSKSTTTENNSANNLTFSEDEDEEANIYDSQGNII